MSVSELKGAKVPIKLWIPVNEVESEALDQLRDVANLPWVFHHVAAMPDVHAGKGCTVGSVIAMKDAVNVNFVGVDIGCGMEAVRTNLGRMKEKDLKKIHDGIRERVPVGFNSHESTHRSVKDLSFWSEFNDLIPDVHHLLGRAQQQIGSLGGGNHFIELSLDENGDLWIMLHSGSRNIGKSICDAHAKVAVEQMQKNGINLSHRDLSVLLKGTSEYDNYIHDLLWAQRYAKENRNRMLDLIVGMLEHMYPSFQELERISCHHNYAMPEHHYGEDVIVTRKGAINAEEGKLGLIPGSMGTSSYVVKGKGCSEAFNSAPHGAGRKMSRTKAKAKYTLEDAQETMKGIVCALDKGMVDEIKFAYKNIDNVMEYASELVEPIHKLTQVINVKG